MKKKYLVGSAASSILLLCLVFVLINGCNKQDVKVSEENSPEVIQKSREQMAKLPRFTTHVVNEKVEIQRLDANGRVVGRSSLQNRSLACPYNVDPIATFENWGSTNPGCASSNTYQIAASFTVSSENPIVADNPNNGAQHTRGRLYVTVTSSGANVSGFPNNNILSPTITDIGADPTDPTNRRIYRITWVVSNVPSSVFSPLNTIRLGLYYFTDCVDEFQYSLLSNNMNNTSLSACQIITPVFPDYSNHMIHGVAACSCCTPDIMPDQHEIEFSRPGFTTTSVIIGIADSYTVPALDIPRGYTYTIRYRNKKTGAGACTGPWLYPTLSWVWP